MAHFDDLHTFIQIIDAGSFTQAALKLGVSKSALSQTVRNLEQRLNIRLLNRTTRSISPTPEGLQLLTEIRPHFAGIQSQLARLNENQASVAGKVRINASAVAIHYAILPKLAPLLARYPHLQVELSSEDRWVDIVKEGFDLGVRLGDAVSENMIAVKISEPLRTALVASPYYLKDKTAPQTIDDLAQHQCIGVRLGNDYGSLVTWDFNVDDERVEYTPSAQLIVNNDQKQAALAHLGIAFVARSDVETELSEGKLVELLPDLVMEYEPFYLYYPNRKHHSKAFQVVVDGLRV